MSDKKIPYLNRTFDEYRESFLELTKKYYPQIANDFNDASIGAWFVDLISAASDNLSYHIDKVFNETNINSAQEKSSLYALARNNGFKIPGPKGAMAEVVFTCKVSNGQTSDVNGGNFTNLEGLPKIKRGTKLSAGSQVFELTDDIDFREQFDSNGVSNRAIIPSQNNNGDINGYKITKTGVVVAGETKIYKQNISNVGSFFEVVIPDNNIMEIESIIFIQGNITNSIPNNNEFFINCENIKGKDWEITRFFEVNSLLEQYRWGDINGNESKEVKLDGLSDATYAYSIVKGEWKPIKNKFITEYTDKGFIKVIFGNGDTLGAYPPQGTTMFIRYRSGGGVSSNVAANTITNIVFLDIENVNSNDIKHSITVTNPLPSTSGKDLPTVDELRNMIKYHNASQERCVTLKDYEDRVMKMPSRYGAPFRVAAIEENNKVMLYLMGINYLGQLNSIIPTALINNIVNYLSMYRTINDYVEIKSGRIINLSVDIDVFVDKNYNVADIVNSVISVVKNYMDINKHYLGGDIFIGDMQKEISQIDGILNLIDTRIYNEYGENYSPVRTMQETVEVNTTTQSEGDDSTNEANRTQIDLVASDYVLISDADCMFEIKYPEKDIRVRVKQR